MTTPKPTKPRALSRLLPALAATGVAAGVLIAAMYFRGADETNEPQETEPAADLDRSIIAMLEAARDGDVDRYLDCFTGEMRTGLEKQFGSRRPETLAGELRASESTLKNFVTEEIEFISPDEATLLLSRTYQSQGATHRQRHRVRLRRTSDEWKIAEMTPLETVAPRIEYGTPVAPERDSQ